MDKLKYCSLDIETSGFDPAKDEILEIGFAFFEMGLKGIRTTEEYTKVFKPKKDVSETILGLTGITKAELEAGEDFVEHREALQRQLQDAVIVGHNINFDLRFLEGFGLKFSGKQIDTLDLVQFILPTHHSYNLENLMHYFGVPHKEAHRALADAKATLQVLEGLLKVYGNFPKNLKSEISLLIEPYNLPWAEFLSSKTNTPELAVKPLKKVKEDKGPSVKLKPNAIHNFPLGSDLLKLAAESTKEIAGKALFIVPGQTQVLALWRAGVLPPAFFSTQLFDEEKFLALKVKKGLTLDELKFVLKILVWQKTNWQAENICELNLSFFGGQFKSHIVGLEARESKEKYLVCDLESYFHFQEKGWYKNRTAVFVSLEAVERALSENISEKVSWGYILYLLKGIYNPEIKTGNEALKKEVEEAMAASDLFFGLVNALLMTEQGAFVQIKFDEQSLSFDKMEKIESAAGNYREKLKVLNSTLGSPEIEKFVLKLNKFFEKLENRIKWIEISENSCSLFSSPINIVHLAQKLFTYNKHVIFCDSLPTQKVIPYFVKRLGLDGYKEVATNPEPQKSGLLDLFSSINLGKQKIGLEIQNTAITNETILSVAQKQNLPAAVLFGSSPQIREFYDEFHEALQEHAYVLAQTSSSGSRMFRNFGIHKETLLLITGKFVIKSLNSQATASQAGPLPVKTLVLCSFPFEQYTHPYQDAVSRQFKNPFEDFSLPKALLNLHSLIRFFYTPALKSVKVYEPKLQKPYAKVFKEYLEEVFS